MRASLLFLAALLASVTAKYECYKTPGPKTLPYCVNMPDKIPDDHVNGRLPTILYLSGSGTFGTASEIEKLSTFDGMGKVLSNYRSGNISEVNKLATERFITIIPIAPKQRVDNSSLPNKHYLPEYVNNAYWQAASHYPVDRDRLYTVGYSGGCRGTIRMNEKYPNRPAAAVCVAGGAEKPGSQYLVEHPMPETFTGLKNLTAIPIKIFAGTKDMTAPQTPIDTAKELQRLGSKVVDLTVLENDHDGLQTQPFTADLLRWLLTYKHPKAGSTGCRNNSRKRSMRSIV
ncbi:alpha/beta-hydrolase [Cystobasidium minutum MCA 4210]|uniref:alpha/beta-hydrolase n=1 Tax=Cystobasidium minutum MCA 4210 TaxID=1397322 RepID=UPI0034CFBBB4|eukprot:jgi/Rhomi1/82048/CE82047_205